MFFQFFKEVFFCFFAFFHSLFFASFFLDFIVEYDRLGPTLEIEVTVQRKLSLVKTDCIRQISTLPSKIQTHECTSYHTYQ